MALLTAQGISRVAIALLRRRIVLPATVTAIPGSDFDGSNGDTITVRVPQPASALEQVTPGAEITYSEIDEIPVDVTMRHLYHAKRLTDEEANFTLEDFSRQVLRIQVDAVARGAEDVLAEAMNDLGVDGTIEFAATASADDTKAVVLAARSRLITAGAPADELFAAVDPVIAGRVLSLMTPVAWTGPESAFRQAVIGQLYGFTFVESGALDAGTALFYHRSGFTFANRTPRPPRSDTADSAAITEGGIGIRSILQYDPSRLSEASVVSTFAGAAAVYEGESSPPTPVRFVKVGVGSA